TRSVALVGSLTHVRSLLCEVVPGRTLGRVPIDTPSPRARPVAVVIPAKDEEARIAATVAGARRIDGVDLVIVVDDGSTDRTAVVAEAAGAQVVRHGRNRGKAAAMESGADAVAASGDGERLLLFLDADLEATATAAA